MSRFLSPAATRLSPYTPGEQPQDMQYVKLNTNESPYPPSPAVQAALDADQINRLNLYSDPTCADLCAAIAEQYGLAANQVVCGNGSDEILSFAFYAFGGPGLAFADITYGFYPVWAQLWGLDAQILPLQADFSVDLQALPADRTLVLANPNAPTGLVLPRTAIRALLAAQPDRLIIVDEAYVDFGGESCVPLLAEFDNLLVVQTFSKSRNLAGGRLGYALGSPALIADLNRVKFSFNPYNINRLSLLAGAAAMRDAAYFAQCTGQIIATRAKTTHALRQRGFTVLESSANFVFARTPRREGGSLYRALKAKGVLVRHFDAPRISDYLRITIGTPEQMQTLLKKLDEILEEPT